MSEIINLPVDGGHVLKIERSGNPNGVPVFLLHGGPGAGANWDNKKLFDLKYYNVFIYDQRGCGASIPLAEINCNTTQYLLTDIREMFSHFGIDKAVFVGGSWGATLSLLYAKKYPESVSALILRGTFLARGQDLEWFLSDEGVARLIPSDYKDFLEVVGEIADVSDAKSIITGVFDALISGDDNKISQVTIAWAKWSWAVLNFSFDKKIEFYVNSSDEIYTSVLIELHYARNNYFLTEEILENTKNIMTIPTTLIHGSRDVMCLPEASWVLSNSFQDVVFQLVHGGGHLSSDPKIREAMIDAIEVMKTRF